MGILLKPFLSNVCRALFSSVNRGTTLGRKFKIQIGKSTSVIDENVYAV